MPRFLLLLALGGLLAPALCGCADKAEAEGYLTTHIEKFYPGAKVIASECLKKDSDGDGYVSCTVRLQELVEGDVDPKVVGYTNMHGKVYGPPQTVNIECAGTWPHQMRWFQEGCRAPKIRAGG